jgi:chemotaxis-related protein WspB
MLVLLFYLGETLYVAKYGHIREVSPMIQVKAVAHAPPYFSGYFNYRGLLVPVFDLRQLIQGEACRIRLSTRIILVDYQPPGGQRARIFGLMAERVTEAVHKPEENFVVPALGLDRVPYLREFLMEGDDMIQCLDLGALIEKFRFPPIAEALAEESADALG